MADLGYCLQEIILKRGIVFKGERDLESVILGGKSHLGGTSHLIEIHFIPCFHGRNVPSQSDTFHLSYLARLPIYKYLFCFHCLFKFL